MINHLHNCYASHLNKLGTWKAYFPVFAAHIKAKGSLFHNTTGFIDCHFQPVSLPGGQQNVLHSIVQ